MASKLGTIISDFQTQLATELAVNDTTGNLYSTVDDDGVTLPNGKYFFTIDGDNSQKEHIACTLTGTVLSDIKSVSRQGVETVGVKRKHRTGATVTITDYKYIKEIQNLLDGSVALDASKPLKYDAVPSITDDAELATKKYVDETTIAGAPDASNTIKGIIKLSAIPVSPTDPIAVGDNDGRVPTQNQKDALTNATGGALTSSNPVVSDQQIYKERKEEQLTADTNTKFGETDATGKVFKKYQTFTPDFNLLGSLSLKKGRYLTPFSAIDNLAFYNFNNDLTDSLAKSGNISSAGSVSYGTDAFGRTNHSRVYGASGYGKDTATLGASISGAFTLETRFTRTATSLSQQNASIVEVGNYGANTGFGIWINYHNTNPINGVPPYGIHLRINQQHQGNQALMRTTYAAPLNVPVKYKFTYDTTSIKLFKKEQGIDKDWVNILDNPWTTNPTSANTLSIGCRGENTTEYVIGKVDYVAITNSATSQIFTEEKTNSDISADVYLDNSGEPTGSSLGTASIGKTDFDTVNEEQDFDLTFTTPIAITSNTTYGFLLSQATPSNTVYPQIRKGDAISTLGVLKNNNTTDGYTSESGNLYAKLFESGVGKLPTLNSDNKVPKELLDLSSKASIGSVSGSFNISTTGSITIPHTLGEIPRKMTFMFAGSGSSYTSVVLVNKTTGAIESQIATGVSDNNNAYTSAANKWNGDFLWRRCSGSSNGTPVCTNTMTSVTKKDFTFNNPADTWGDLTGTVFYTLEK